MPNTPAPSPEALLAEARQPGRRSELVEAPRSTKFQPGHSKTGGRGRGVPNKDRSFTIEKINQSANPIEFLCRIVNGEAFAVAPEVGSTEVVMVRPTLADRLQAARVLADKVLPSLK